MSALSGYRLMWMAVLFDLPVGTKKERKAAERARKATRRGSDSSLLADVPVGLPALSRAMKLGKRAARVGFDWPDAEPVLAKLDEELADVQSRGFGHLTKILRLPKFSHHADDRESADRPAHAVPADGAGHRR